MNTPFIPVLRFRKNAVFASIQGVPLTGFRHMGVPMGGWLDTHHALLCNQRLGNRPESTLIEMMGPGAEIEVLEEVQLTFTGARAEIEVDGTPCLADSILHVSAGQVIKIGCFNAGNVLYLGLTGQFWTDKTSFAPIRLENDTTILAIVENKVGKKQSAYIAPVPIDVHGPIFVTPGPEFFMLDKTHLKILSEGPFTVSSRSDRMGFLLDGPELNPGKQNLLLTSPVMPGIIQWLPAGKMLVLMRDCQTTGGYPRILILEEAQINKLAQRPPGSVVRFEIRP